jgi:hypothetical protein
MKFCGAAFAYVLDHLIESRVTWELNAERFGNFGRESARKTKAKKKINKSFISSL